MDCRRYSEPMPQDHRITRCERTGYPYPRRNGEESESGAGYFRDENGYAEWLTVFSRRVI